PTVSGTPAVGDTLSCSTGTWEGSTPMTFTYQWVRLDEGSETKIEAATGSAYKIVGEDAGYWLACIVTATNGAGSASAKGEPLHVTGSRPHSIERPKVLGIDPATVGE